MLIEVRKARNDYFQLIQDSKRQHWKTFLADPSNVWKAGSMARSYRYSNKLPILQTATEHAETDETKARALLEQFFPPQPPPIAGNEDDRRPKRPQLEYIPLRYQEIRHAIFSSAPDKAAGINTIPFRV